MFRVRHDWAGINRDGHGTREREETGRKRVTVSLQPKSIERGLRRFLSQVLRYFLGGLERTDNSPLPS